MPLESPLFHLLDGLRAAADHSRLRLLAVCAQGEWTVSELVQVMGQSQPRISRHLKILAEAGLLERFREGGWVFYRRAQAGEGARLARTLCRLLPMDDPALRLDRRRLETIREARRAEAAAWFDRHAAAWDAEQDATVDRARVDAELVRLFDGRQTPALVDIGTGTGRILQLLASRIGAGTGVDLSHDMLRIARANLDRREARNCQVRHGDMYALPLPDGAFDAATLHQVLHFADDPLAALEEAVRVLKPGGRLVVVDLARHDDEAMRERHHHRRLGFSHAEMSAWFGQLGLIEEPAITIPGRHHTLVIWHARRPGAVGQDRVREDLAA